ncbi:hypothetical protein [Tahibacter aquaticus]|uniref:hypothetical protein n=1 Tax=Tahibacter aquaticus TaxID=520092 RepID=UPI00105E682B|nr:hypothetical protein [Tahibacter aquaticus]
MPFLFAFFLFGPSKEKEGRAPQAGETAFAYVTSSPTATYAAGGRNRCCRSLRIEQSRKPPASKTALARLQHTKIEKATADGKNRPIPQEWTKT